MKCCPECNSIFAASEKFCELDGAPLIDSADNFESSESSPATPKQFPVALAATAGLVIGVLLALIYLVLTHERTQKPKITSATAAAVVQQQLLPTHSTQPPQPIPSPSPEPSPSPSPSVTPSPTATPTPEQVKLSGNPISTTRGQDAGPLTIKLNTGLTIEADEAWQTSEGVWYRKGGMVSLLDPKEIKSVEKTTVR